MFGVRQSACKHDATDASDILPPPLKLDHSLPAGDDVDEGKLHEGEEDETGADKEPDVDELDVGDLRQIGCACAVKIRLSQPFHIGENDMHLWVSVMRVSQVEVPRVTRPGTALGSSQKLTMLINTWVDTYFINT